MRPSQASSQVDYQLLLLTLLLILFGLVMLASASGAVGYERFGDTYFFAKQQAVHILLGCTALFICARIPASVWPRIALPCFLTALVLLVLVFVPGVGVRTNAAHSWLSFGPVSIQPAEFAKVAFLLYSAVWLEKRRTRLHEISYGVLPFFVLVGLLATLILLQPDVGTVAHIVVTAVILFFIAGARASHLISVATLSAAVMFYAIATAPYRIERIRVLLDPARDPQGVGYHARNAAIAIGSGGWWGLGLGQSRQKYSYLPETAGDSIFAVMGEELGFIFTTCFIALLALLVHRLLRLAGMAPSDAGRFFIAGTAIWICIQALYNIGAMLGIMPLTGVPLPLVSFGGSAMIALLAAIGICISFARPHTDHR